MNRQATAYLTRMPVGRRVASLRTDRGISQQVFADQLGYTKSWVDKVERGVRELDRLSVLRRVADTLDVALAVLVPDTAGDTSHPPCPHCPDGGRTNLCPYCLDELPDDYPYDHVAIDLALAGNARIHGDERYEAVRVGLARGMSPDAIGKRLHLDRSVVRQLAADIRLRCPTCGGRRDDRQPVTAVTA